ncbi:MAG: FMN-binding glutamate synthase family protein [Phycisphaerales bacterium]|nr:FMN-binding glutamate synthase family protein [Phycisphaerales bacterium]
MRITSLILSLLLVVFALLSLIFCLLFSWHWLWGLIPSAALGGVAIWDRLQPHHSILRNYPLLGHLRFMAESIRPEIMQYFVEQDEQGRPYNRTQRSAIYERAKNVEDVKPFGTQLDVYNAEYEFLTHSITPRPKATEPFRVTIGGSACTQPYSASLLNISAMSFGALSPNALLALNKGAQRGNFYHDTGEGGVSPYHLKHGGDLVWEIGTGYFGCRTKDGQFDPGMFHETAVNDKIKMVEIKVSQGAKAGHGGVLPGPKVDEEIARVRGVPVGKDCISPAYHKAFSTPIELLEFTDLLRQKSGGKPSGFKLCIGRPYEFLAICKAMLETGVLPDYIVVDGGEGGTGAGPVEFLDHLGLPLTEGLLFVHNALVGCNLRDKIKVGCSAKISNAFSMASRMAIGADWCNAARAFMFSVGCIQAQRCHTNTCPVGVATQDPKLYRGLVVDEKADRAYHFHRNTLEALAEVVAAAGLDHPSELTADIMWRRINSNMVRSYLDIYEFLEPGELVQGGGNALWQKAWDRAQSQTFKIGQLN